MPKDLVNTHGKGLTNSLWKYWWSSSDKSEENYSQIFETDCNKHDICYGCVSKSLKLISYEIENKENIILIEYFGEDALFFNFRGQFTILQELTAIIYFTRT